VRGVVGGVGGLGDRDAPPDRAAGGDGDALKGFRYPPAKQNVPRGRRAGFGLTSGSGSPGLPPQLHGYGVGRYIPRATDCSWGVPRTGI
jgi:hypothetical protein